MPYVHYLMNCLNCSKPIPLPPPKNLGMQPNQGEWPTDGWKKFFLCLECKHVREYSRANVQMEIQDTQSPWELGEYLCWSIQYKCDERSCGTQIETFAISDISVAAAKLPDLFLLNPSVPRLCARGHWTQTPQHPKEFDAVVCSLH